MKGIKMSEEELQQIENYFNLMNFRISQGCEILYCEDTRETLDSIPRLIAEVRRLKDIINFYLPHVQDKERDG
jgi:hypothetical protein